MQWLAFAVQLLPSILKLVGLAEEFFTGPKRGSEKKEFVIGTTKTLIGTMKDVSTGGQKKTWERLEEPVNGIIDNAVEILFPHDDPMEEVRKH